MNRKARARLAARKKASRPDRFIEDGYSHWKFSKGKSASPESKIENVDIPADEISQLTSSDEEDGDEDLSASGGGQAPVAHSDPTLVADFDPSQPRDKGGKWSKEGGSGGEGFHRKTLAGISDKFRGEVLDYVKKQGWDEKEFEHRLDHEVHRLKTARAAAPERYSSADHEAVVKDVMGQVMSQMRTEARQKEAEDFKKLRAEKLAQPVPSPPSVGASTAQVQILSKRTPEKVEEHVRKVLGEHATMQDVASLAGAAHGAVVTVSPGKGASSLTVRVKHPDYVSKRTIYKDENGNLVLHNDEFFMKPGSTGKGLGAEVFGRQVEHAQRLGVSHIETLAGGPPAMNGYYTWPRFGYDQHLDSLSLMSGRYGDQKIRAAREKFPGVESVSDIFLHHGGAEWWKTNGLAMPEATFDLKSGSRSLKVWHSYLAEKVSSRSSSSEPVSHSSQLVEDVALMVNVNPRYDPLDHEVDDIGNGEENYDFSPEVETSLDAAWEKLREELDGDSPVAHFDPSQARDSHGRWSKGAVDIAKSKAHDYIRENGPTSHDELAYHLVDEGIVDKHGDGISLVRHLVESGHLVAGSDAHGGDALHVPPQHDTVESWKPAADTHIIIQRAHTASTAADRVSSTATDATSHRRAAEAHASAVMTVGDTAERLKSENAPKSEVSRYDDLKSYHAQMEARHRSQSVGWPARGLAPVNPEAARAAGVSTTPKETHVRSISTPAIPTHTAADLDRMSIQQMRQLAIKLGVRGARSKGSRSLREELLVRAVSEPGGLIGHSLSAEDISKLINSGELDVNTICGPDTDQV
jgi:hypothetical protein